METTRNWKVFGKLGHRQRESFNPSVDYDFSSEKKGIRKVSLLNADKTGTNEYTIIRITRNTAEECEAELEGQLSDGVFENCAIGAVIEITDDEINSIQCRQVKRVYLVVKCLDQSEYTEGRDYASAAPASEVVAAFSTEAAAIAFRDELKAAAGEWDGDVPEWVDKDDSYDPRSWEVQAVAYIEEN